MDKQQRLLQLITLKLSGEASTEDLEELERYLITEPEAGYTLEMLQQIWNPAANPGEEPDLEASYRQHREKYAADFAQPLLSGRPADDKKKKRRLVAAIVVLPLLLLLAGVGVYWQSGSRKENGAAALAEITASRDTRTRVVLPDGTVIRLNKGSRLTYDKEMNEKKQRSVFLNGEGYFEVSGKKDRVFIIQTKKIRIEVLGTSFNVKAYEDDPTTEATLLQGKIAVSLNNTPGKRLVLNPNEKFLYTESSKGNEKTDSSTGLGSSQADQYSTGSSGKILPYRISKIDAVEITHKAYNKDTAWLHDQLIFQNEPFRDIIPELEKRYEVTIALDNDQLASVRYTAILEKETLEQVLKAMQLIKPFHYTITSKKVIIE